ncbi:MAG: hypothetical protein A2017_22315 [Lentisphaerae bacterium GWF2_44_16]|nr:MAG: hypothetical protein A2017_22315 [Lentisphaerae bacterium GWF2_44_16]
MYYHKDIDALNSQFALKDNLAFKKSPADFVTAEINNKFASASICLYSAHVMSYLPHGQKPVLWMSAASRFEEGKPIRGGIPLCWPWFGAHPSDKNKPAHGLARISPDWKLDETELLPDGVVRIQLSLSSSDKTRELWEYAFELKLIVSVGAKLSVEMITANKDSRPFTYRAALHSYFAVSNVSDISVSGLDGSSFIDTLDNTRHVQNGPITINSETDRIYPDSSVECVINDPAFKRHIHVSKSGSLSTVVWNPWIAKSQRMEDFGDDEYPSMLCVETAITAHDEQKVRPGASHSVKAVIKVEDK